jgi:hypothetical protein
MLNLILNSIDRRCELQRLANDRNLFLTGCGSEWTVCDGSGTILALATDRVAALSAAIFGA